jgi:hypothetical protein
MEKQKELIEKLKEQSRYLYRQLKKVSPLFGSSKLDRLQSEISALDKQIAESKPETLTKDMTPRVAKLIIQIRDLFITQSNPAEINEETWHLLYQIASPNFDKNYDEVWKEIESLSELSGQSETWQRK